MHVSESHKCRPTTSWIIFRGLHIWVLKFSLQLIGGSTKNITINQQVHVFCIYVPIPKLMGRKSITFHRRPIVYTTCLINNHGPYISCIISLRDTHICVYHHCMSHLSGDIDWVLRYPILMSGSHSTKPDNQAFPYNPCHELLRGEKTIFSVIGLE